MKKKILIVGATVPTGLMLQKMREEHGEELEFFTAEQAEKNGLDYKDFANIPTYTLTAPKMFEQVDMPFIESSKVGKGGRARNRSKYGKR